MLGLVERIASQSHVYDCVLPIALQQTSGNITSGSFTTPTIPNSDLPGLLGLDSLESMSAIVDFGARKMYIPGPGGVEMPKALPPGTDTFQLQKAPSGHLLLPCTNFGSGANRQSTGSEIALLARQGIVSSSSSTPVLSSHSNSNL